MIEIQNLSRRFGALEAVRELNLNVPRGELFCFLGPNGAGKTTTIKMLCGLLRPSSGRIRIGGIDLAEDSVSVRRFTGYIPDAPYVYERLTPTEFFNFVGRLHQINGAELERRRLALLGEFDLLDAGGALIKDLSHGMRQRLVYAVTFLHEPKVLFIDEPFVGLDPYTIRHIRDLLRAKTRAGMTVFLTTHILPLAEDMADRIGIIREGRLVACGPLTELLNGQPPGRSLEDVFLDLTARDRPKE